jgi:hypothetical protein
MLPVKGGTNRLQRSRCRRSKVLRIMVWGKDFRERARPRRNGSTNVDITDRGPNFVANWLVQQLRTQ